MSPPLPPHAIADCLSITAPSTTFHKDPTMSVNSNEICHGRVKEGDFERMVPAQWWKTVFADGLYLKTDGDVVEDPEITREEIRLVYLYEVPIVTPQHARSQPCNHVHI